MNELYGFLLARMDGLYGLLDLARLLNTHVPAEMGPTHGKIDEKCSLRR